MSRDVRIAIEHFDEEQRKFDAIPICRWCGAECDPTMDHCPQCGRKVRPDRAFVQDAVDGLKQNFGIRVMAWMRGFRGDEDEYADVREQTFGVDEE